jgi:chromosome segregation ATPase
VISEGDKAFGGSPSQESERDALAERRARRAWLSSPALARRAEAAEATVHTLEAHLADLRHRQVEAERERESAAVQLTGRERELRRVKQREYAEQQLRVEAEEAVVRLRRGHRVELDRLQRRAEEAHAAARRAEEQRDALAARLAAVSQSCARLEGGVAALQSVAAELRATFERDHLAAQARIAELERELKLARSPVGPADSEDPAHREEMAGALAAAAERLRARAVPAPAEPPVPEVPPSPREVPSPREIPTVFVVPRLFAGTGRLRPVARRIAARLAEWAGPAQEPPRS